MAIRKRGGTGMLRLHWHFEHRNTQLLSVNPRILSATATGTDPLM